MSRILKVAALAFAASIALSGCSVVSSLTNSASDGASAPETSGPNTSPAAGEVISGSAYGFNAPEGWTLIDDPELTAGLDVAVADTSETDGFANNVNVVLSPAGEITPEEVEEFGVAELEDGGATNVTVGERVMVAGSESAHLSAGLAFEGFDYQVEQYYAARDGQSFIVTFSFSHSVSETEREDIASSVLTTWSWN